MIIPNIWKKKNVPNHQPVYVLFIPPEPVPKYLQHVSTFHKIVQQKNVSRLPGVGKCPNWTSPIFQVMWNKSPKWIKMAQIFPICSNLATNSWDFPDVFFQRSSALKSCRVTAGGSAPSAPISSEPSLSLDSPPFISLGESLKRWKKRWEDLEKTPLDP